MKNNNKLINFKGNVFKVTFAKDEVELISIYIHISLAFFLNLCRVTRTLIMCGSVINIPTANNTYLNTVR